MNKRNVFWATLFAVLGMGINFAQAGPGTKADPVTLGQPFGQTYTYYANSPAGPWSTATSPAPSDSGTAMRKFVDSLPGLGPQGANNLGNFIPVANKAVNPVAGDPADYYEIELIDYRQKLHSDLPAPGTKLRGYRDLTPTGNGSPARYLGPLIIAKSYDPTRAANLNGNGAPVRIKYYNHLANGVAGNLFIPVDTTAMGAGEGPLSNTWDPTSLTLVHTANTEKYTQNRAMFHLHGGVTPWISDGTPHQWFTPAGEVTSYKRGVSQVNVPDMPDPGDGAATYYYSNQQSARLMFYHDHAYGLTRLNVYAGEAAGYLLYDQTEQDLISGTNVSGNNPTSAKILPDNGGGLYTFGIPLIIQDKTFVPKDIAVQDAKWSTTRWGAYGDLWYPHVYEPNQNPLDASGANPYGRWDYGPWFWPPVQVAAAYQALPATGASTEPCLTPEAFMDTPIVNGQAYPFLPVEPKAYRFRILNAANDRPWNLQLYVSDPASAGNFVQGGRPTEVAMVPAAPHPDCTATDIAATTAVPSTCTCTAAFAPFGCFPATWPADGRDGGVPDPQFAGPKMIQIGTEGGLLPAPVVLDNQPLGYEYNRRNIVVLDVLYKTLMMGPAERADVLVDFSAYAGKTIILYNDAPAPNPAFDVRYDYYTNDPDQTFQGGAPSTKPGYGPNTRTIMQFRVAATTATPFTYDAAKMAALTTGIQTAFTGTQPTPIVPEPDYAANFPADPSPNLATPIYSTIFDNSLTFTPLGGGASQTVNFVSKAIQELWDPWGRMNATLGVELPKTSNTIQTTIPFGYADPATEVVNDSQVQIWKITHNGVDTHPVHFHLFDVQLINRVGWDGAIRPPDPNEVGWKETVKMKPLEDVIVALRPALPKLPFGIPTSTRPQDPTLPLGAQNNGLAGFFDGTGAGFMGLDPVTGNPITVTNALTDYGHEYVWHCHILGHEENDFMRPMTVVDNSSTPATPTLSANLPTTGTAVGAVNLTWSDATPANALATLGNPRNEIGFRIFRCGSTTSSTCTPTTLIYTTLANATSYVDGSIAQGTRYRYRIAAFNASGASNYSNTTSAILTPANLPPHVSITAPAIGVKFPLGAPVTVTATATAAIGQNISGVTFWAGGTVIGTKTAPPFSVTWTPPAVGIYNLAAVAADNHTPALVTTSALVPITVTAVSSTITAPASGASFTLGSAIPITASASAVTGLNINLIEFYAGGQLIGSGIASPSTWSWTGAATGVHVLTSKAYYSNGTSVTSAPVSVNVLSTTITSPVAGAGFNQGSPITITAAAAGLVVTKVDFFADGLLIGTSTTAPYSYTWTTATGGVHSLTAKATFSNAAIALSPAVSVSVLSTTILSPANGSTSLLGAVVPITASVATATGITVSKIDFLVNAALVGTATAAPYSFSWTPAATGAYSLTAKATLSNATTVTSAAVTVTVAPSVAITAPLSGASFSLGSPIALAASSTAPVGASTLLVEYYADGATAPIGYGFGSPYNFSWTTATLGAHTLTAIAYYSTGTTSTSVGIPVTVIPPPPLAISTTSLPAGGVNAAYNQVVAATGGFAPYTWSATGLPSGLVINPTTGVIGGIPGNLVDPNAVFTTFPVSVTVQDSTAVTVNKVVNLAINQTAPAAPSSLAATATASNQVQLTWVNNANNEFVVQIQRATDAGFTVGLTSVNIAGTLTTYADNSVAGSTTYFYRVRCGNSVAWSAAYSNTATATTPFAVLGITTTSLPNGGVNVPYLQAAAAVGGTAPYTWSATGLPGGLAINPVSGVISGTPANLLDPNAASTTFPVTVTVQDATATTVNKVINLIINQTAPAAPSTLTAVASAATQVNLTWVNTANNQIIVHIQRATDAAFTIGLTSAYVVGTATAYTDNTVTTGTTYFYRVRCGNSVAWSATYSSAATVTTP